MPRWQRAPRGCRALSYRARLLPNSENSLMKVAWMIGVSLSDSKIRFQVGESVLTSKLIDGTFPGLSAGHSRRQRQDYGGRCQGVCRGDRPRFHRFYRKITRRKNVPQRRQSDESQQTVPIMRVHRKRLRSTTIQTTSRLDSIPGISWILLHRLTATQRNSCSPIQYHQH